MKHKPLKSAYDAQQRKLLETDLAQTKKALACAVEALEGNRKIRPVKLPISHSRPRLKGDTIRTCIPDTHGAKVDKTALSAVLGDVAALQPHEIILLGDHVDCGGFLAQHHVMGYVAETSYSYEDDLAAANDFLDALRRAAPNAVIGYIEGNHEARIETWAITQTLRHQKDSDMLRRALAPEFRLKLAERGIKYYRRGECYDGLTVPGVIKRDKCYYFHGFSTARNATAVTHSKVAGNCVFGHTHRAQSDIVSPMSTGIIGSWNPGCLCERQPMWQHGRPTDWTHGYANQMVSHTGQFLHLNIPIIEGRSLFTSLLRN